VLSDEIVYALLRPMGKTVDAYLGGVEVVEELHAIIVTATGCDASPEGWERRLSERLHWPSYFPILIQRSERRRSMQNESLIFAGQLGSSIDETNHEDF